MSHTTRFHLLFAEEKYWRKILRFLSARGSSVLIGVEILLAHLVVLASNERKCKNRGEVITGINLEE